MGGGRGDVVDSRAILLNTWVDILFNVDPSCFGVLFAKKSRFQLR